jgi:hypothetical protein
MTTSSDDKMHERKSYCGQISDPWRHPRNVTMWASRIGGTYLFCFLTKYAETLTGWSIAILENLIITQPVKKFPAFYETRGFITAISLYSEPHDLVKLSLFFNWSPFHEGVLGEWSYRSTHSWTRHWMEVSGEVHSPAALPRGRESPWYPLDKRLGGRQNQSGRGGEEKVPSPCRD